MLSVDMTVAQAYQHAARQHPSREALVCGRHRATYGQLAEGTEALARGAQELGLRKGDRVATLLYPGQELICLFLAVARLGGVIVPMNAQFRRHQLNHILSDAQPLVVVTSAHVGEETLKAVRIRRSESLTLRHLVLTEGGGASDLHLTDLVPAASLTPLPATPLDSRDLLALLYTSGTTGLPKGAMHSHRSLIAPVVASLRLRQMWISRPSPQMMAVGSKCWVGMACASSGPRAGLRPSSQLWGATTPRAWRSCSRHS